MMVEKRADNTQSWMVDQVVGTAIEHIMSENKICDEGDRHVKVERLSNNILAMSVHESRLWRVLSSLQAKGIEPYRCFKNDTSAGEYELLYITSENPELDMIRYQKILDSAA